MYEEEVLKNEKANRTIQELKLEIYVLKAELERTLKSVENSINKAIAPLQSENKKIKEELVKSYKEIERLKIELQNFSNDQDYLIDKLNNQINRDSTNSSIPTSKESIKNNIKRRTNTYNHRKSSNKKKGAQYQHKGKTLTKEEIEKKVKENNLVVKKIKHYVDGKKYKNKIEKYKIGIEIKSYVEKHIFIPNKKSDETLPSNFYSDVTYANDLKSIVVLLGNYCFLPYNKIKELISDLTNEVIQLSDGTIDNIYNEFSLKSEDTIANITNNILNGSYQHTDETVTTENGKDTYYRGYGNKENVLYKYHEHKGDKPIEEDGILTRFFGILITDHDKGMFKYGTNNQDCIIHFGRYCIEQEQNIKITSWQMRLYSLLLKFEKNRQILIKFGKTSFGDEEIKLMEEEYDEIVKFAVEENENILSSYWKEKANALLKRCIKYKRQTLWYIHDFSIDYDNNFMERALRMIKSKTKISGGFRSHNGGIRFGNIMSIIKTSKLRHLNPFYSIINIMNGKNLFAY